MNCEPMISPSQYIERIHLQQSIRKIHLLTNLYSIMTIFLSIHVCNCFFCGTRLNVSRYSIHGSHGIEYQTKQQYKIILVPQSLQTIKQIIICNSKKSPIGFTKKIANKKPLFHLQMCLYRWLLHFKQKNKTNIHPHALPKRWSGAPAASRQWPSGESWNEIMHCCHQSSTTRSVLDVQLDGSEDGSNGEDGSMDHFTYRYG